MERAQETAEAVPQGHALCATVFLCVCVAVVIFLGKKLREAESRIAALTSDQRRIVRESDNRMEALRSEHWRLLHEAENRFEVLSREQRRTHSQAENAEQEVRDLRNELAETRRAYTTYIKGLVLQDPTVLEYATPGRGAVVRRVEVQASFSAGTPTAISVDLVRSSTDPSKIIALTEGDICVPLRRLCGVQCDEGSANAADFVLGGSVEMGRLWPGGILYCCLDISCLSPRQREQLEIQTGNCIGSDDQATITQNLEKAKLTEAEKATIREGIRLITDSQQSVKILEQPTDIAEAPHCVVFINDDTGPWSPVGQTGTLIQRLAVSELTPAGSVAHELLHSLGFHHTHSRSDRDSYLTVDKTNIEKKRRHNFKRRPEALDVKQYDYSSIMHYGPHAWAIDPKKKTLIVPEGRALEIGQRRALSAGDLASLAARYPGKVNCTFGNTSKEYHQQAWFRCLTCWGNGSHGCCMACALSCHKGHTTLPLPPTAAYCDCGACNHHYKCTRFATDLRKVLQPAALLTDGSLVCGHCSRLCITPVRRDDQVFRMKEFCCSCTCSGDDTQNAPFHEVAKYDVIECASPSPPSAPKITAAQPQSGGCLLC